MDLDEQKVVAVAAAVVAHPGKTVFSAADIANEMAMTRVDGEEVTPKMVESALDALVEKRVLAAVINLRETDDALIRGPRRYRFSR